MKRIYSPRWGSRFVAVFVAAVGLAQPSEHDRRDAAPRRRSCRRCRPRSSRATGSSSASSATCRRSATSTCRARTPASTSRSGAGSRATRSGAGSASRSSARRPPQREPLITTGRVDLVISTFTYTADRDTRIDFSRAYWKGDGPAAREEQRPGAEALGHRRQEGGDDERLGLRQLDEELLQEHGGDRCRHVHERDARVQPGPCRRGHVRRRRAAAGGGRGPRLEDHRRRLPRRAVRHRHEAGLDADEGVGRLAPRLDEGRRISSCRSSRPTSRRGS